MDGEKLYTLLLYIHKVGQKLTTPNNLLSILGLLINFHHQLLYTETYSLNPKLHIPIINPKSLSMKENLRKRK
jgi:hypothetical protein